MRGNIDAIPFLEGMVQPGQGARVRGSVGGLQSSSAEVEGCQVWSLGTPHFTDRELHELAGARGTAEALGVGWRRYGQRLTDHLSGSYLACIWSPADSTGLVALDRFGSHALFWAQRDGRVAFATRPARVCALLGIAPEIDARAVHAYVYFHMIPAPLSIHKGVQRLDIAQMLMLGRGGAEARTYWHPAFDEAAPFDFDRERDAFRSALRAGVAESIEGVPRERLGCFLSGGTDSSTIAGLATEALGARVRTFSIGFDVSGYDERYYSRLASAHFGTEHTEHVLTPDEAEQALDVLAASYEQPFGNSSAVPTFVCARIAREAGVQRMLGGDGGDELYGGNERYATQWLFSLYDRLPGALRAAAIEPLLLGPLGRTQWMPVRKARGYVEQARVRLPDRLGAKYNLLTRFGPHNVFSDAILAEARGFEPLDLEREVWARCDANSQINRLLAYDFKFTLGDNDLPKVMRMCHAAGAEVAFPMLANPVVEHSLRVPPRMKLRGRELRYFFREALRGFLPNEIIDKSKHGFGMPFGEWLLAQPQLSARALDALSGLEGRGLLRPGFLQEVSQALRGGHAGYYGTMVWVLMMLELWLRAHEPAKAAVTEPA